MHKEHSGWWAKYNWLVLSFLSCCFSFHDQSFWIDECCTASCAVQPSLEECWRQICRIGGSDAQIAFYYYLLFLWHQVTGAESELALRLFNGVWVFLAGWFFRKEPKALVILLLSPFFIYYRRTAPLYFTNCGFLRGDHAALSSQQRASAKVSCAFWCLVFPVSDKPDRGCLGLRLYSCFFHLVIPAVQRAEFLEGRVLLDFPFCRTGCVLCLYPFPRGSFRGDIFQLGC